MRRLQCKRCSKIGNVVEKKIEKNHLYSPERISLIYTVECRNCHHKWHYRRNIK